MRGVVVVGRADYLPLFSDPCGDLVGCDWRHLYDPVIATHAAEVHLLRGAAPPGGTGRVEAHGDH